MSEADDTLTALKAADAAGDSAGATRLAQHYQALTSAGSPNPQLATEGNPMVADAPSTVPGAWDYSTPENALDMLAAGGHHMRGAVLGAGQLAEHASAYLGDKILPSSLSAPVDAAVAGDDAKIRNWEQQYQNTIPNSAGAYAGAAVGEVLPWMTGLGELRAAGLLPKATTTLGRMAVGAGEGAGMAAAQPVTGIAPYANQKAAQVAAGTVTGGAIPAIGAALAPIGRALGAVFNPGAAADAQIAGQLGTNPDMLAQLQKAGNGIPGYTPTVAGALTNAGTDNSTAQAANAYERMLRNKQSPTFQPFNNADAANAQAHMDAIQQIAGSPEALQAAKEARTAATQPFIEQNLAPAQPYQRFSAALQPITDALANVTGKDATSALAGAKKIIQQVMNGSMQEDDAVGALKELGDSVPETLNGQPSKAMQAFDSAHAAINRGLVDPSAIYQAIQTRLNSGIGQNPNVRQALSAIGQQIAGQTNTRGLVGADILDGIRQNANRFLAAHPQTGIVAPQEIAGVAPIASQITDTLNSAIPGFRDYLGTYAKLSEPINTMESGQSILDRVNQAGRNTAGNQAVSIPVLKAALKRDDLARYPMSDDARKTLNNVLDALQERSGVNNVTGASGPGTAADAASLVGPKVMQGIKTLGSSAIGGTLGYLFGGPEAGMIGSAVGPTLEGLGQLARARVAQQTMQRMASAPAAANALQAFLERQNPVLSGISRYLPRGGIYASAPNPLQQLAAPNP